MHAPLLYRSLSDRGRLLVRGPDGKRFLHGMLTNDVSGLGAGMGCHAAMLTVKGKMLADLAVYDLAPEQALLLQMEGVATDTVLSTLARHLIMDDASVEDAGAALGQLGVYGAGAASALASILGMPEGAGADALRLPPYHHREIDGVRVAATKELGVPGYHLFMPAERCERIAGALAGLSAHLLSEEEAEVLRVEAGTPRYGIDMDSDRLPVEANLEDAVSYSKGCYLGQEVIARLGARGHVNRRLVGLRLAPDGGPAAPLPVRGSRLAHESRADAGVLTSVVRSPRLGPIALGYVHRSVWEPGTVLSVLAAEGPARATATIVTLPFAGA